MGLLNWFRKRRAIKFYAKRLPKLLIRDYGRSRAYTPAQLGSSIERHALDTSFSCYEIAMFSGWEGFDQFHAESGAKCDYEAMRAEIVASLGAHADFASNDAVFGSSDWDGGHGSNVSSGGGEIGGDGQ